MLLLQRRQGSGCNQNLRADANACLRLAMTAEFCFRARGAERGAAAEGMGMELSVAPPWELGSGNGCPPCRGFYGFPDTSPMVYRGFSDSEELLRLCFCSS